MSSSEKAVDNLAGGNSHQQSLDPRGAPTTASKIVTFIYEPQPRAMMETYGRNHGIYLPNTVIMQQAFLTATRIREEELPKPVQDAYYAGIDFDNIQTSEQLTEAANQGMVALQNCYFDDFLTAEYYRGACRPDKHNADPTVPLTTPAQKAHVQLLVRAFYNTNNCDDNPQMVRPFLEKRHDPKLVEVLCWGILKTCIMRSNSDEPLLTAYEPSKSRNSPGVNNFADRFNALVKSMSRSKTICKHLYDPPYVNVFVDDPVRAVRRVDANRDLNRLKGHVMGKGKRLLEEEGKANGGTPEPRGRKRRAPANEDRHSSAENGTPERRSLVVKVPVRATPTPEAGTRGSQHVSDIGPTSSLISPQYTAPDAPMSSRANLKEEEESHHSLQTNYSPPPCRPQHNASFGMSQAPTFAHFEPFQSTSGYGCPPSSSFGFYNPGLYSTSTYGTGLSSTRDFFSTNQLRQRQARYAAQQSSFAYAPIASRAAATAASTPSLPGFISGEVSSNTANSPMTPPSRIFAIPEDIIPTGEAENMIDEGEDPGAEFGVPEGY